MRRSAHAETQGRGERFSQPTSTFTASAPILTLSESVDPVDLVDEVDVVDVDQIHASCYQLPTLQLLTPTRPYFSHSHTPQLPCFPLRVSASPRELISLTSTFTTLPFYNFPPVPFLGICSRTPAYVAAQGGVHDATRQRARSRTPRDVYPSNPGPGVLSANSFPFFMFLASFSVKLSFSRRGREMRRVPSAYTRPDTADGRIGSRHSFLDSPFFCWL